MKKPRLFLHIDDAAFEKTLLQLDEIHHFIVVKSSQDTLWTEQLQAQSCDIALIDVNTFPEAEFNRLNNSNLLSEVDFIFLNQGLPNQYLDNLMAKGAGFLLRNTRNIHSIQTMLRDISEQICTGTPHKPQQITCPLDQFGLLVGSSDMMFELYRAIRKVAVTKANVLIIGESGVGKELVASTVHLASPRLNHPFVAINCGSLSPELVDSELFGHEKGAFTGAHKAHQGAFEQAEGGTLFLDEITEMPLEQQVKLLRILESGEYRPVGATATKQANVRIIAATNRDPLQAVSNGLLREDLYFRLAQFPLRVPPLRERADDIIGLAQHFIAYRNTQEKLSKYITADTLALLTRHHWPGNVRELKHTIERAFILADNKITPEHLVIEAETSSETPENMAAIPAGIPLEDIERAAILNTLQQNEGNKAETAQQLGISVKTLYNKLEKYQYTNN